MKIPSFLSAVEPTQLLQTVLSTYVQITTPNRGVPYCQTILQGGLLTAASITGVGACASEGLTLVADLCGKGCKKTVGAVQYLTGSEYVDRYYQSFPDKPPLSYRIERIVSQGLGIVVSVLGTLFLLAIKVDWAIRQHQSLGNYLPTTKTSSTILPSSVDTGASAVSSVAGPHAAPTSASTTVRPRPTDDHNQAVADAVRKRAAVSPHLAAQTAASAAPVALADTRTSTPTEPALDKETIQKPPISLTGRPGHNADAGRALAAVIHKQAAKPSETSSLAADINEPHAAASPASPAAQPAHSPSYADIARRKLPPTPPAVAKQDTARAALANVAPTDLTAQNAAPVGPATATHEPPASPASATSPVATQAPASSSGAPRRPPPPPPPPAKMPSLATTQPGLSPASTAAKPAVSSPIWSLFKGVFSSPTEASSSSPAAGGQALPEIDAPRSNLLAEIRARGGVAKIETAGKTNKKRVAIADTKSDNQGANDTIVPLVNADDKNKSTPSGGKARVSTMGLALAKKFSRAAGSSDSGEGPFFRKTTRGYYLGGDCTLEMLISDTGMNFALSEEDTIEDTLDQYLFTLNNKIVPKKGQKFVFKNEKDPSQNFELEIQRLKGPSIDRVNATWLFLKDEPEKGVSAASAN